MGGRIAVSCWKMCRCARLSPGQTAPARAAAARVYVVIGNDIHAIGQESTMITIFQINCRAAPSRMCIIIHMKSSVTYGSQCR